ncbi:MAG: flagellar export protein FliJ [Bacteroidota bacterium]
MAKKFHFRLEPVLKIKSHEVRRAKDSLSKVVSVLYETDVIIKERKSYHNNLLKNKLNTTKVSDLQAQILHRQSIMDEIRKLEKEKEKLVEIESLRRAELNTALKDEKVLSKLKEKQFYNHNEKIKKIDSHLMDEIALKRHKAADNINRS